MRVRSTVCLSADAPGALVRASASLAAGGLVAFPTETVYGLGADATAAAAVAGIFEAKGRPAFNPLIVHVASTADALDLGAFSPAAELLAAAFWPGALTLVVPHRGGICDLARSGLDSLALRVPSSAIARQLIAASGRPIAAPSANRSGHVSPVSAAHVARDLDGRIDVILDGGPCSIGVESTIVACLDNEIRLLRPGGIASELIESVLQRRLGSHAQGALIAPGMLASHYAPRAQLRLNADALGSDEAGIDFGGQLSAGAAGGWIMDLSPSGSLAEAAARLFTCLRALDDAGVHRAAVAPIPGHGLGAAINDRLGRAATNPA